jgi:hypothetical protein
MDSLAGMSDTQKHAAWAMAEYKKRRDADLFFRCIVVTVSISLGVGLGVGFFARDWTPWVTRLICG